MKPLEALRIYNEGRPRGQWIIPKPGTKEYRVIEDIMAGVSVKKAVEAIEKPKEEVKEKPRSIKAKEVDLEKVKALTDKKQKEKIAKFLLEAMKKRKEKKKERPTKETKAELMKQLELITNEWSEKHKLYLKRKVDIEANPSKYSRLVPENEKLRKELDELRKQADTIYKKTMK